ncbi:MAG: M48 family metallopeptidase [Oscillospiraceae bacterium]|nr:M48 family metallopeptidase [Oscillospiraceae bacterium]
MKTISSEQRILQTASGALPYTFERKNIRNINLRIRPDGCVYVSAPEKAEIAAIERFLAAKTDYIRNAREKFAEQKAPSYEMQYVSGENVTLLGRNLRIQIVKDKQEFVGQDGIYVYIHVRRPDYYSRKKNLLNAWLNEQCTAVFTEIMQQAERRFAGYGVSMPKLRIRNMVSRWGSCQKDKGTIALNRRLIEAPKNCIEYVVIHEFCHLVHPNHSKQFYALLQVMLPDWRESKDLLEKSVCL